MSARPPWLALAANCLRSFSLSLDWWSLALLSNARLEVSTFRQGMHPVRWYVLLFASVQYNLFIYFRQCPPGTYSSSESPLIYKPVTERHMLLQLLAQEGVGRLRLEHIHVAPGVLLARKSVQGP